MRLQDFEQQILDYLHAKHGAAAVESAGYRQGEAGSVTALLRAIAMQGAADAVIKAAAHYPVVSLTSYEPSLEDIFLRFYERDGQAPKEAAGVV